MANGLLALERGLTAAGVNVHGARRLAALPAEFRDELGALIPDLAAYTSIAAYANGGQALWPLVEARVASGVTHPIDSHVRAEFQRLAGAWHDQARIVYPAADLVFPVQRLGRLLGLCQPSVLGLDMHSEYGLWFAFRLVVLLPFDVGPRSRPAAEGPSICEQCALKSCRAACPPAAVGARREDFQLRSCLAFRVRDNSPCMDRCLARWNCSYKPEHRYPLAQLQYHMARPEHLAKIKEFLAASTGGEAP